MPRHDLRHEALLDACLVLLRTRLICGARPHARRNDTGLVRNPDGSVRRRYGHAGAGDATVILPPFGHHLELEIKTGTGRPRPAQLDEAAAVTRACGTYLIIHDSVDELAAWLDLYTRRIGEMTNGRDWLDRFRSLRAASCPAAAPGLRQHPPRLRPRVHRQPAPRH